MSAMPEHIILWRHAEAKDIFDSDDILDITQTDMQRPLTQKGQRQAADMAMWLKPQLPKVSILQCSPALRAFQTAEALQDVGKSCKININQALKPGVSLNTVLANIAQFNSCNCLVLVGHQPWLGQLAAHFLGISMAGHTKDLPIKKGAIWWLRLNKTLDKTLDKTREEAVSARYIIHTVQTPSLL